MKAFFALLLCLMLPVRVEAQEGLDVPFVTTPDNVTLAMLRLAGVRRGEHLIDLGSGDGRIVITAARRFGATGLGVEIVPELVERSRVAAQRAGVSSRVRFEGRDLFDTDLAPAQVITMYLLPEVNLKLRPRLLALEPGTRIVSHDWDLGDWAPDSSITVDAPDKPVGREKLSRLHLWHVPAAVQGAWCGASGWQMKLDQQYQRVSGELSLAGQSWSATGRLHGADLHLLGASSVSLRARWTDRGLHVTQASGEWRALRGQRLRAAGSAACP